jgi:tRNA modification GTPase
MDVDTIAALSTAPGVGAVAVVRISGPDAFAVLRRVAPEVDELAPRAAGGDARPHRRSPDDGALDQALVTRFVGPDSYTGEDVVEISCHGGVLVPQLVLDACLLPGPVKRSRASSRAGRISGAAWTSCRPRPWAT